MKAAVCAVLLLLSLFEGEALRCYKCIGKGGNLCNPTESRKCRTGAVCAAFIIKAPPLIRSFRTCMSPWICRGFLKKHPGGTCCDTDLCN